MARSTLLSSATSASSLGLLVICAPPASSSATAAAAEAGQGEVCDVANDNGGGQVVVSGNTSAVERAVEIAKAKGAKRAMMLKVSAPFLVAGLAVGLIVSVFQAATNIQEQTLTFIPKLIAISAMLVFTGPWMLKILVGYTHELFESIPSLIN